MKRDVIIDGISMNINVYVVEVNDILDMPNQIDSVYELHVFRNEHVCAVSIGGF